MFNSAKRARQIEQEDLAPERRKSSDRRVATKETRFPFIDENSRLVMKNRRNEDRRASDVSFKKNPLKIVNKLLGK